MYTEELISIEEVKIIKSCNNFALKIIYTIFQSTSPEIKRIISKKRAPGAINNDVSFFTLKMLVEAGVSENQVKKFYISILNV